jgi:DNA-binding protein H-NS
MAKPNLASMTSDALLKLRNEIGAVLGRRAEALKKELRSLGEDYARVGRIAIYGKKKATAKSRRRVAAKYRDPKTKATWAGRGTQPAWMREAIRAGKKSEDFLIAKPRTKAATKRAAAKRKKK